jgi:small subunit ribosomal protein S6
MAKPQKVDRAFESLFICPSDTPQKTIDNFIEKIKTALAPSKGILRGVQVWGRRRLTYPIKHHKDGLYIFIDFTGERGAPESLKTLFRVTDFILRHLITHKVVLKPPFVRKFPGTEGAAPHASAPAAASGAAAPAASPQTSTPPSV